MAKSKSGTTKEDRASFLERHGWHKEREGKGSHSMWVNPDVREMAFKYKIDMPESTKISDNHAPWMLPMCLDPANGTWARIQKHVQWCNDMVQNIRDKAAAFFQQRTIKHEFNNAVREIESWKRESKHRYKTGLATVAAPPSYHKIDAIAEKRQQLKQQQIN